MTPLEQAHLLIKQDPLPIDIEDQLSALEREAKGTDEEFMFNWIWESIDTDEEPERI